MTKKEFLLAILATVVGGVVLDVEWFRLVKGALPLLTQIATILILGFGCVFGVKFFFKKLHETWESLSNSPEAGLRGELVRRVGVVRDVKIRKSKVWLYLADVEDNKDSMSVSLEEWWSRLKTGDKVEVIGTVLDHRYGKRLVIESERCDRVE